MISRKLTCLAALICGVLLPAMLAPVPATASFYSGMQLYSLCTVDRASASYVENTYECVAYISGAVDAFNTRQGGNPSSCIPSGVTINGLRAATVKYLRDNPMKRDEAASALVFAATRAEWPCAAKESKAAPVKKKKAPAKKRRR